MKFLVTLIIFFSFPVFAEKCEGLENCAALYTKFTGKTVDMSDISSNMSWAVKNADVTPENAEKEFTRFLALNAITKMENNKLLPMRHGEFMLAPIYLIEDGKMPQVFSGEGLVTLVYQSKKDTAKLVTTRIRKQMSFKKTKSLNNIVEFKASKVITVSDRYDFASKVMQMIMKADSK